MSDQERYQHTQLALRLGASLVGVGLLIVLGALVTDQPAEVVTVTVVVLVVLASTAVVMSRLTVTVDTDEVRVAMGWGWPSRTVPLGDVTHVTAARGAWWHGIGIHRIPGGTLWNVAGLDAVELGLPSGRFLRIGTDDPDGLIAALAAHGAPAPTPAA